MALEEQQRKDMMGPPEKDMSKTIATSSEYTTLSLIPMQPPRRHHVNRFDMCSNIN